jgi:hypothetical protein
MRQLYKSALVAFCFYFFSFFFLSWGPETKKKGKMSSYGDQKLMMVNATLEWMRMQPLGCGVRNNGRHIHWPVLGSWHSLSFPQ